MDSDTSVISLEFLFSTNEDPKIYEESQQLGTTLLSSPFTNDQRSSNITLIVTQATSEMHTETYTHKTSDESTISSFENASSHTQNVTITPPNTPLLITESSANYEMDQSPTLSPSTLDILYEPIMSSCNDSDKKTISEFHPPNGQEISFMDTVGNLISFEEPTISACDRETLIAPIETLNKTTEIFQQNDNLSNELDSWEKLVWLFNDHSYNLDPVITAQTSFHDTLHSSTTTPPSTNSFSNVHSSMQTSEKINLEEFYPETTQAYEICLPLPIVTYETSSTDRYKVAAYFINSIRKVQSDPDSMELVVKYMVEHTNEQTNSQQSNQASPEPNKITSFELDLDSKALNIKPSSPKCERQKSPRILDLPHSHLPLKEDSRITIKTTSQYLSLSECLNLSRAQIRNGSPLPPPLPLRNISPLPPPIPLRNESNNKNESPRERWERNKNLGPVCRPHEVNKCINNLPKERKLIEMMKYPEATPETSRPTESESNNGGKNNLKKSSFLNWIPDGIFKHLKNKPKKK